MKHLCNFIVTSFVGGLLIVLPIYLSVLLILKAMKAVSGLVRPVATLLPAWLPAEKLLSFLVVVFTCFIIGEDDDFGEVSVEQINLSLRQTTAEQCYHVGVSGLVNTHGIERGLADDNCLVLTGIVEVPKNQ